MCDVWDLVIKDIMASFVITFLDYMLWGKPAAHHEDTQAAIWRGLLTWNWGLLGTAKWMSHHGSGSSRPSQAWSRCLQPCPAAWLHLMRDSGPKPSRWMTPAFLTHRIYKIISYFKPLSVCGNRLWSNRLQICHRKAISWPSRLIYMPHTHIHS